MCREKLAEERVIKQDQCCSKNKGAIGDVVVDATADLHKEVRRRGRAGQPQQRPSPVHLSLGGGSVLKPASGSRGSGVEQGS